MCQFGLLITHLEISVGRELDQRFERRFIEVKSCHVHVT